MKKNKGLGRGLDALLGDEPATTTSGAPQTLPVGRMRAGKYQPRTHMAAEALAELADSIRSQGVIQPILVRPLGDGDYEIIAGERRFRAAQMAGLNDVPVVVRDVPDEAALAMALIENIQREDLNPLEEAQGVQRLIAEFAFTHERAAQAIGRSRSATSNLLRLLQLAAPVQGVDQAPHRTLAADLARDLHLQVMAHGIVEREQVVDRDALLRGGKPLVDEIGCRQRRRRRGAGAQQRSAHGDGKALHTASPGGPGRPDAATLARGAASCKGRPGGRGLPGPGRSGGD